MTEKTTKTGEPEVGEQSYRGTSFAPQCPPPGTNETYQLVRRRKVRYQRKATYHYHHNP